VALRGIAVDADRVYAVGDSTVKVLADTARLEIRVFAPTDSKATP
jgi:hypothetical protein